MSYEDRYLAQFEGEQSLVREVQRLLEGDTLLLSPQIKFELFGMMASFKRSFPVLGQAFEDQATRLEIQTPGSDRELVLFLSMYVVLKNRVGRVEEARLQVGRLSREQEEFLEALEEMERSFKDDLLSDPDTHTEIAHAVEGAIPRSVEWHGINMNVYVRTLDKARRLQNKETETFGRNEDAYLLPGATPSLEAILNQVEKDEKLPGLATCIREVFSEETLLRRYLRQLEYGVAGESRVVGVFDGVGGTWFSEFMAWISTRIVQAHAEGLDELTDEDGIHTAMYQALHHAELVTKKIGQRMRFLEEDRVRTQGGKAREMDSLGTTACVVYESPEWPGRFFGKTIGDSEVYHWNKQERTLTRISESTSSFLGLHHDDGTPAVTQFERTLQRGDKLVLASDGLGKLYSPEELERLMPIYEEEQSKMPLSEQISFSEWILLSSTLARSFQEAPVNAVGERRRILMDDVTVVTIECA